MSVLFWSDLHFGHRLVAGLRGFGEDTDAHDAYLCDRWRTTVHPKDQVWLLGDLALARATEALALIADLPGEKHLIAGNHDKAHPLNRDSHKWQPKYLQVFASVQTMARRRVDGQSVMLSHFPYTADDRDRERSHLDQYRLRDQGLWLLHGHTHSKYRWDGGRQVHVGVDAWPDGPASLEQVASFITPG